MLAVLFGALAGMLFGLLAVTVRLGLRGGADPQVGASVLTGGGFVVATVLSIPALLTDTVHAGDLWPFFVLGMLVPGCSQILFILSVRDAGPSRAAILIGTSPLISVSIALVFLNEPFEPWLLVGTALIVAGGAALALERARPEHFKMIGAVLALTCAGLFAVRDNIARSIERDSHPPALVASAVSLLGAFLIVLAYLAVFRRDALRTRLRPAIPAFAKAGVVLGLAYSCLLEAFDRGRVTIVAPLNATQSLWAVVFAAVLIGRRHEGIGPRLVAASCLVVLGGAIIGIVR